MCFDFSGKSSRIDAAKLIRLQVLAHGSPLHVLPKG